MDLVGRTDLRCLPLPGEGSSAASNGDVPSSIGRAAQSSNGGNGSGLVGAAGGGGGRMLPSLQGPGILEIKCPYNGGSPETARPPKRPQWWASVPRVQWSSQKQDPHITAMSAVVLHCAPHTSVPGRCQASSISNWPGAACRLPERA